MPQRFLRPGIRNSERWNSVSRTAQALYIAILTLVDDYGRYDGRPSILWAGAFTIWNEKNPNGVVTPQQTAAECQSLMDKGLVLFYEVDGKRILQVLQWEERIRAGTKEKWPKAPKNPNLVQFAAESCGILPPTPPPPPSPSPTPTPSAVPVERVFELAKATAETLRAAPTNEQLPSLQRIINALYSRPDGHRWSYAEECALAEIARRESCIAEAELLVRFRKRMLPEEKRFFPQSVSKLMEKWDETLDRARLRVTPPAEKPKPFKPPAGAKKFEHSPELAKKFREAASKEIKS